MDGRTAGTGTRKGHFYTLTVWFSAAQVKNNGFRQQKMLTKVLTKVKDKKFVKN